MEFQVDRQKFNEMKHHSDNFVRLSKQIDESMALRKLSKDAANTAAEAVSWKARALGVIPVDMDVPPLIGGDGTFRWEIDNDGLATFPTEGEEVDTPAEEAEEEAMKIVKPEAVITPCADASDS